MQNQGLKNQETQLNFACLELVYLATIRFFFLSKFG